MNAVERFYAVLCEAPVPSSSLAHDERWVGPFASYTEAELTARFAVESGNCVFAHVCKRLGLEV